jgi:hypothetical protein
MANRRYAPEKVVHKLGEADRTLNERPMWGGQSGPSALPPATGECFDEQANSRRLEASECSSSCLEISSTRMTFRLQS